MNQHTTTTSHHQQPSSSSNLLEPNSLDQIYTKPSIEHQSHRWSHLIQSFHQSFLVPQNLSPPPQFIARAPGRVNIIGEHIDYCGFSVLPAAIEPDLLICGSVVYQHLDDHQDQEPGTIDESSKTKKKPYSNNPAVQVKLLNLNPVYPEVSFEYNTPSSSSSTTTTAATPTIPIGQGGWSDYVKSAFNVCLDYLKNASSGSIDDPHHKSLRLRLPSSIQLLIDGSVPAGSGLSSSAAITTASVITVLHIHRSTHPDQTMTISKELVASLAIQAERACGISVGGMDQTASVFGQPDKLLHIEFEPETSVVPLDFPRSPSTTFIIANSLVSSKKLESSKEQYNLRVVECRIATRILYDQLITPSNQRSRGGRYPKHLRELVQLYSPPDRSIPDAIRTLLDRLPELEHHLGGLEGSDLDSILTHLRIDRARFETDVLDGLVVEPRDGIFKPYRRARHVLTEALRVHEFRDLLQRQRHEGRTAEGSSEEEEVILRIGRLMDDSQRSCQLDYDCSCPQIDRLVSIVKAHPSLGSRLTGAGWGGSTVHLVRDEEVSNVIEALKSEYYSYHYYQHDENDTISSNTKEEIISQACFATKPQAGACLFTRLDSLSSSV